MGFVNKSLTEQSQQMLAAVHVAKSLASMLAVAGIDLLVHLVELLPLEAVEQDTAEGLVEVLLDAGNDFFEDVGIRRARSSMSALGFVVLVQELRDGCWRGHRRELLFFGDLLPVVY